MSDDKINTDQQTTTRENASASSLEDDKLVERAVSGDQEAYKTLTEKYETPLYYHLIKMVKDKEQVRDLVQEAFMKAFDNLESYNTNYAFSTWLYRITTNHAIDYLRKKKLQTTSIDEPLKTREGEMKIQIEDEQSETDRTIIRKQRSSIIHEAIEELPEKYRVVIKLRHFDELSYDEISEQLDLPLGTVKAHIFRAREMLYKELKDRRGEF
ncbi:RNA polymerase sigma factor [Rhodohalobacter barkolensis]|uniref:RNA polymerase subunit sigma-24 n=1 Tax=Rhodohalobacter barkolensis TaxID=2053187 RepID=A0A2N0VJT4_9BACT|nr:sigma-70 family RNA polymerase sigma factor [Rhodohalobacter barkolensis]PKD44418.1 RNA polymerase subunit sigma-24 [Rhodohalobacter barkolensis]